MSGMKSASLGDAAVAWTAQQLSFLSRHLNLLSPTTRTTTDGTADGSGVISSTCNHRCVLIVGCVVGGVSFIAICVIVTMCLCYCCLHRRRDTRQAGLGNGWRSRRPNSCATQRDGSGNVRDGRRDGEDTDRIDFSYRARVLPFRVARPTGAALPTPIIVPADGGILVKEKKDEAAVDPSSLFASRRPWRHSADGVTADKKSAEEEDDDEPDVDVDHDDVHYDDNDHHRMAGQETAVTATNSPSTPQKLCSVSTLEITVGECTQTASVGPSRGLELLPVEAASTTVGVSPSTSRAASSSLRLVTEGRHEEDAMKGEEKSARNPLTYPEAGRKE